MSQYPGKLFYEDVRDFCQICKEKIDNLGGNPGMWGMELEYLNGNGKTKVYHRKCVAKAIYFFSYLFSCN